MPHSPLKRRSVIDQVVEHLREGIFEGRWKNRLPGALKLSGELGVSRNTAAEAVSRLITAGLVLPAEGRRPHAIASGATRDSGSRYLRVALLLMTAVEKHTPAHQREILLIMSELKTAGHECVPVVFPSGKNAHKTGYLQRFVRESAADAWLVFTGTREILEWFAARKGTPVLAIGGRCRELPIAAAVGYDSAAVVRESTRRLIALGHRRIVLISDLDQRRPEPSRMILAFRAELEAAGVKPGEFNTPDWEENPEGLVDLLKSLFRFTPPTALICNNLCTTGGAAAFLARIGLHIPGDVSVVSLAHEDILPAWIFPGTDFAHVEENHRAAFRRIREWVTQVAENRADTRQVWCKAHLVEGNTLGPAKDRKRGMDPDSAVDPKSGGRGRG